MHAKSNIARLYLSRRKWGIGLIRPDVERKKKAPHAYISDRNEWILKATSNEKVLPEEENLKDCKKITYEE